MCVKKDGYRHPSLQEVPVNSTFSMLYTFGYKHSLHLPIFVFWAILYSFISFYLFIYLFLVNTQNV